MANAHSYQTAIVTGGTGLLGRTVVHYLLEQGVKIGLPYRDERKFRLLRGGATEGGFLFGRDCDLIDPNAVEDFVQWTRERFRAPIDVLICCSGGFGMGKLGDSSPQEWQGLIDMNLTGVVNMCRAVVPEMAVRNRGKVVTIGGVHGVHPIGGKGFTAYASAKAGLQAFTQALAAEVHHQNVQVNMIVPTFIVPNEQKDEEKGTTPEQILPLLEFLCSDAAEPITGNVIRIPGTSETLV